MSKSSIYSLQNLLLIVIAALTVGLFMYPYFSSKSDAIAKKEEKKNSVTVAIDSVHIGDLTDHYRTVATVQGREEIRVLSQVEGVLQKVHIQIGDSVRRGQSLAQLDNRIQQAALQQAKAQLAHANEEYERAKALTERRLANVNRLQTAVESKASAEAEVSRLSTLNSFTGFQSPIRGVVTQQNVYSGDNVAPGRHLFTVSDVSRLLIITKVPEAIAASLKAGDPATVIYDPAALSIQATVLKVYPASDALSHQVGIEIDAGATFPALKPGYQVSVMLAPARRNQVLVLDRKALVEDTGTKEASVFVIRDAKAEKRLIRLGLMLDTQVEVLEGLKAGELVATRGTERLKDGSTVKISEGLTAKK